MATHDAIQLALSAPMDWAKFETIVADLLRDDDLPSLRKLGGGADKGLDGVQETFYEGVGVVDVAVQVTSQKSQRLKVANTLEKLKKNGIHPKKLVVVFRDECSTPTRAAIKEQGAKAGIEVDVRDQSYLVTELGRSGSTVFLRHFSSDLREQVDQLLGRADPLAAVPNQLKQAVLASFAAFLPDGEGQTMARGRMFDQSVLAVIASADGIDREQIRSKLREIFPEFIPQEDQLSAALGRLRERNSVVVDRGTYRASRDALAKIALAANDVTNGFQGLFDFVREKVEENGKLNDAELGYLERNCRKAVAHLVRLMGPGGKSVPRDEASHKWLTSILGRSLPRGLGKAALFALTEFVGNPEGQSLIAPLARAYSVLAIRNLDPLGRRWQASVLQRSILVLDTDAALGLLVEELPQHAVLRDSLRDFLAAGSKVVVPTRVLAEMALHAQNASRVYLRVGGESLSRLPEAVAAKTIWNAITRGFWYARGKDPYLAWEVYLAGYLVEERAGEFIAHVLSSRLPGILFDDFDQIDESDQALLERLIAGSLRDRELSRLKAQFRDPDDLEERLRADLKLLLKLSSLSTSESHGYLVTEDRSFWLAEESEDWLPRSRVAVRTRLLPELAQFCCGTSVDDEAIVALMFEPALLAAGELLKADVEVLAKAGANLRGTSLVRLEWDLREALRGRIHAFKEAQSESNPEEAENAALRLLEVASARLELDPTVESLARDFRRVSESNVASKQQLDELREKVRGLMFSVAGDTSKGRTRARRALRELGLEAEGDEIES